MNARITHPERRAYALRYVKELAPSEVTLKQGAVVLTTRVLRGIPTATQGVVTRCLSSHVICQFSGQDIEVAPAAFDLIDNRNERLVTRFSIPLVLAWAMKIHRAQEQPWTPSL